MVQDGYHLKYVILLFYRFWKYSRTSDVYVSKHVLGWLLCLELIEKLLGLYLI
jgi:hypothetical protein